MALPEADKPLVTLTCSGINIDGPQGLEELIRIHQRISKCSDSISEGKRLENISWRLWRQLSIAQPAPVNGRPNISNGRILLDQHHDELSDPEDGASLSSLSDTSLPSVASRMRRQSINRKSSPELAAASAPPSATFGPRNSSPGPVPARLSPSGLQTLINNILEPAELTLKPLPTSITTSESPTVPMASTSTAVVEPVPVVDAPAEASQQAEADIEEVSPASSGARSRLSETATSSTRTAKHRAAPHIVHHAHHRHARTNLRRNVSERAIAHAHTALHSAQPHESMSTSKTAEPARPSLARRGSSSGDKAGKTVRIAEAPVVEMARTTSRDGHPRAAAMGRTVSREGRDAHHRKSSSTSLHSVSGRSSSSHASLTTLEPRNTVIGFQPMSASSVASTSRSPPPALATSPAKPSSLRQSIIVRPPSDDDEPVEPITPQTELPPSVSSSTTGGEEKATKKNMFFVGSDMHDGDDEDDEDDTSSGWGSDHGSDEEAAPPPPPPVAIRSRNRLNALGGGSGAHHLRGASMPHLPLDEDMFRKRPVRSSVDLVAAGEPPRVTSQSTLTLSLLNPPNRPGSGLFSSKSANHVPSRRLGGRPEGIEMSDDSDSEEEGEPRASASLTANPTANAQAGPGPSTAASRYATTLHPAALPITTSQAYTGQVPPMRSPDTVRRDILRTELSVSLRTNLFTERSTTPAFKYKEYEKKQRLLELQKRDAARKARREQRMLAGGPFEESDEEPEPIPPKPEKIDYFSGGYHRRGW